LVDLLGYCIASCYGKLSVRLSVRDVEVSWSHRLEFFWK